MCADKTGIMCADKKNDTVTNDYAQPSGETQKRERYWREEEEMARDPEERWLITRRVRSYRKHALCGDEEEQMNVRKQKLKRQISTSEEEHDEIARKIAHLEDEKQRVAKRIEDLKSEKKALDPIAIRKECCLQALVRLTYAKCLWPLEEVIDPCTKSALCDSPRCLAGESKSWPRVNGSHCFRSLCGAVELVFCVECTTWADGDIDDYIWDLCEQFQDALEQKRQRGDEACVYFSREEFDQGDLGCECCDEEEDEENATKRETAASA